MTHIESRTVFEFIGLDYGYRTCEVGLLDGAVTDNHSVLHHEGVFFEGDANLGASVNGDLLGHIAKAGDCEDVVGRNGDGKLTINVRDSIGILALEHSPYHRT